MRFLGCELLSAGEGAAEFASLVGFALFFDQLGSAGVQGTLNGLLVHSVELGGIALHQLGVELLPLGQQGSAVLGLGLDGHGEDRIGVSIAAVSNALVPVVQESIIA